MSSKKKEISITVELDENNIPTSIDWNASDKEGEDIAQCRAMLLSMWDHQKKDTLRLDLWTKEMTIDEMKIFFHQTLVTMADTLQNATNEDQMAEDMRDFTAYFADKMEITE
ncbi:gliding motility protein GldC [Balneolaceae bacterium YR4-1]|uniref:Gliding motility protein GldC n=1 Tax=Halalkalibaculum roseum TaxID=2709311 RepID=A0A6M1T415_9BACT|nr:gliding motility protein GldC [Halalkalibaculum roseum]NGP77487.1 gliding motility protein GldC [Halalkalibaculum roseum]